MILSSFEDFLHQNSVENRVVLEVGKILPGTNIYPTFDLWCICFHHLAIHVICFMFGFDDS